MERLRFGDFAGTISLHVLPRHIATVKILVVGSGGREHALAWKLRQSSRVDRIFCAPGNAGTEEVGENVPIPTNDQPALVRFAKENDIGLTVIGPDDPLAAGISDLFQENGLCVFGPSKSAARLESSKIFAKELMRKNKIPTARGAAFSQPEAALAFIRRVAIPTGDQGRRARARERRDHSARHSQGAPGHRLDDDRTPFWRRRHAALDRGMPDGHGVLAPRAGGWEELSLARDCSRSQARLRWGYGTEYRRHGRIQPGRQFRRRPANAIRSRDHASIAGWPEREWRSSFAACSSPV